jgi:acyl-CoA reductase-like NAD-dependent aldehyde dehydrogenase
MSEGEPDVPGAVIRLKALRAAALSLTCGHADLLNTLRDASGLSRQGVALALNSHLEWDATDNELRRLAEWGQASVHAQQPVTVVLSANVFTAAFRALALALACSAQVQVKPSRREPLFIEYLSAEYTLPGLSLLPEWRAERQQRGAIHVYGRHETIAAVQTAAQVGVDVWGHGTGFGIAIIDATADLDTAANLLASDVIAFDQRGCLSPRIAFVLGGLEHATSFAAALDAALARREIEVPRGMLAAGEASEITHYVQLAKCLGRVHSRQSHNVALQDEGNLVLPPSGRNMLVAPVSGPHAALERLGELRPYLTCVGTDLPAISWPADIRISHLGQMQRPRLDGPVDLRSPLARRI